MRTLWFVVITVSWTCSATNSFGQATQATGNASGALSEVALRKILSNACNRANAFYKEEHFAIMAPSPDFCSFKYAAYPNYQGTVGQFDATEQSLLTASILPDSGKLVMFYNMAAGHAAQDLPKQNTQLPPKWTSDHAIELATQFADIFTKNWKVNLGKPHSQYGWTNTSFNKNGNPQWPPGQWTVKWTQQTPSGIPYRIGGMSIVLSEKYGPFAVFLNFPAQYEDEHITPISQAHALIAARAGLDNILAWEPAKTGLGHVQVLDTPAPTLNLMIIQPNNITVQKSVLAAMLSNQPKARLAWVVSYKVVTSTGNGDGTITVYVDAKDGSLLGGEF